MASSEMQFDGSAWIIRSDQFHGASTKRTPVATEISKNLEKHSIAASLTEQPAATLRLSRLPDSGFI